MSVAEELMTRLARLGVKIAVIGNQLQIDAPKGVMSKELKQDLIAHKPELLTFLKHSVGGIQSAPPNTMIPLTSGQDRLWSLIELQHDQGVYNVPMVYRLRGSLDIDAFAQSLNAIQSRHSILRTRFVSVQGKPKQQPIDVDDFSPTITDLTHLAGANQSAAVNRILDEQILQPFDLGKPPLWRCALLVLSLDTYVLMFTMHHIVFDLYSKALFLRELEAHYEGERTTAPQIQYCDYAYWQQSASLRRRASAQLEFWKTKLDGALVELLLPTDHPRPAAPKMAGGSLSIAVSMEVTTKLSGVSRAANCTMYMTLLAAFHALLHRCTGQTDHIVCTPFACRSNKQVEALIGYFNNIVPIRTDLSGNPAFHELLARVRAVTLEAMTHQDAPFQQITELPSISGTPLTRGMFNFRGEDTTALNLTGISATQLDHRRPVADFDLALYMGIEDGRLVGVLDYNAEIFEDATIARISDGFLAVLDTVATDPNRRLSALPDLRQAFPDIEEALRAHPKVDDAVLAVRSDARGSNRVAYLVLNEDDVPSQKELQAVINERLFQQQGPLVFVPVDTLPTLATGAVDFGALPAPALSRTSFDNEYVAPRTPLEKKLVEIWQNILWRTEKVGIHDNFFDLGGHSLLSVQLILETERQFGLSVPLDRFGQLSTVAEFAEALSRPASPPDGSPGDGLKSEILHQLHSYTVAWSGKRRSANSLITGLNTDGNRNPAFWVVQRYLNLSQLAKHLGPAQPIYGLRSGHKVMGYSLNDVQALAGHYVNEILEIHGSGPFIIGGVCQASEIAFEIALKLLNLGHEVKLLCLQERFVRQDYPGRVAFLFGDISDRNPYYHFARPELGWRKYYTGVLDVHTICGAHGTFFQEASIQSLTDEMRLAFDASRSPGPNCGHDERPLQRLSETAYRAKLSAADPTQLGDGDVQLSIVVENVSSCEWLASKRSGVYLGARWLNPSGRDAKGHDRFVQCTQARTPIATRLAPGDSVELELDVTIPDNRRLRILEIDMVDEGITWFADAGSEALQLDVRDC